MENNRVKFWVGDFIDNEITDSDHDIVELLVKTFERLNKNNL